MVMVDRSEKRSVFVSMFDVVDYKKARSSFSKVPVVLNNLSLQDFSSSQESQESKSSLQGLKITRSK
jgi:hypothetical protein